MHNRYRTRQKKAVQNIGEADARPADGNGSRDFVIRDPIPIYFNYLRMLEAKEGRPRCTPHDAKLIGNRAVLS